MRQRTIREAFTIKGKGLHSGLPATITFCPAPVDFGYRIKRIDLEGEPVIRVSAENVINTQRSTVLSSSGVEVATVEHALAALYGCEIDNCLIEIDTAEFPILDGSSAAYSDQIHKVGFVDQPKERVYYEVDEKIEYIDTETGSHLMLFPAERFSVHVQISFDSEILDVQSAYMEELSHFAGQISMCRTFVFIKEIEALLTKGLIKGGDLDNAIVIYDQQIQQKELDHLADIMRIERKTINETGYIMNRPLLFPNEPARHKLLDIIGDIAITGRFIRGAIIAVRPGHRVNNLFAREIMNHIRQKSDLLHVE